MLSLHIIYIRSQALNYFLYMLCTSDATHKIKMVSIKCIIYILYVISTGLTVSEKEKGKFKLLLLFL